MIVQQLPPITHPQGKYWQQPPVDRVLVDELHALMTEADFEQLLEYSTSIPTGSYVGKMWKREQDGEWWLGWMAPHETPGRLWIHWRRILLA